jgi:poly(beta-D-mannuronate) lyase
MQSPKIKLVEIKPISLQSQLIMKMTFLNFRRILYVIVFLEIPFSLFSQNVVLVFSVGQLQSAINNASAGDTIKLADGTYYNSSLVIGKSSIAVKAATPGSVFLNGTNDIQITGNYIIFSGFQFTSGTISGTVANVSGSHNTLTQLNFKGYSAQKYINLQGRYNEISSCNFENKPTTAPQGDLIHITPDEILPGYNKIRYCSFQNMPGIGGDNGNECIRISNGSTSTYVSRTIVEFCYFNNTGFGDSEAISVKCRENILRYNTSVNNQRAMFCFRNGDNNIAYGNFFIGAGGIRVKEANNIYCYNNYFERSGLGGYTDAVTYVYFTDNTPYVLNNINFFHNSFVECGDIDLDHGAVNNTWANNIFKKSSGNIFTGSTTGIAWAGNIYDGTLGVSIPSGMTKIDPALALNPEGFYGLTASSPAIDAASANYPAILDISNVDDDPSLLLDISGQQRPVSVILKDVGCDEYTTGASTNHPLALNEVGPSYLVQTAASNDNTKIEQVDFKVYPSRAHSKITMDYNLISTSNVCLSIINMNGITVKNVIMHEKQPAGKQEITADISGLKNGIYFVCLETENFIKTLKLIVCK